MLKSYVASLPVEDGIYFEAGERNFLLKGRTLHTIMPRLLAMFDGTRTLDDIKAAVPEKLHPLIDMLFDQLSANRMIHLVKDDAGPEPSPLERRLYADTIAFLQDETENWASVFRRWRGTEVLVAGSGASFAALAVNLALTGVRTLFLAAGEAGLSRAERAGLDAAIDEHRGRDAAFEATWLAPEEAQDLLRSSAARVLYVSDALGDEPDPLLGRLLLDRREGTLVGGVRGGAAFVGPELHPLSTNGIDSWAMAEAGAEAGLPYPRTTLAILGALVAFEALKSGLYDLPDSAEGRDWARNHFFRLSAAGTISVHTCLPPVDGAPVAARVAESPAAAAVATVATVATATKPLDALMDPVAGLFRWTDVDGPEFPLPHRAIVPRVPNDGQPGGAALVHWALTPQELDERTTILALERLMDTAGGCGGDADGTGAPLTPVVVARTEADWRAQAYAVAFASSPWFEARATAVQLEPESVPDPDAQTLFRLARLYTGRLPEVRIACVEGMAAFVATAAVGDNHAAAIAATAGRAIVECLGDALSALQLGRPAHRQDAYRRGPGPALARRVDLPVVRFETLPSNAAQPPSLPEHFCDGPAAAAGFFAGRVGIPAS